MTGTDWSRRLALSVLALAALATAAHAQGTVEERVAALKRSLAENAAAQRNYTWIETTQIELNGEVKSTNAQSCRYVAGEQSARRSAPRRRRRRCAGPCASRSPRARSRT